MKAPEMKRAIKAAGLVCESCHYQFGELKQNLDERIAFAKELGLKYMVLSMFGVSDKAPLADWTRAAGELNKVGELIKKAGLQPVYHNHNFEFRQLEGVLIYDHLLSVFDKDVIKLQFQVAVISDGYQAATYFEKYSGRFVSMHLADWSTSEKKQVPIGAGVVDWKRLFPAARSAALTVSALKGSTSRPSTVSGS